ncbi:MAG TPA: hypothetical protein PLB25_20830, partial [Rhodoferax sp.]|nr:hypothetical protein [Rhodoferax sp.]
WSADGMRGHGGVWTKCALPIHINLNIKPVVPMKSLFFYLILSLLIVGCGQREEVETRQVIIAQQQVAQANRAKEEAEKKAAIALANQKAAEEKAAVESSSSQRIIFGLGVGALLAFFVGVGLGSASRKVAAKASSE